MVGLIWKTISGLKCILAISFIAKMTNNKSVIINLPPSFWRQRIHKLEKMMGAIVFNKSAENEIFSDTIVVGNEQKIIAIMLPSAAALVIIYNGSTTPEAITTFIVSIKTALNHIIPTFLLREE